MSKKEKRYEIKCPVCGKIFWAFPSIFQTEFGLLEYGSGICPDCHTKLNLTLDIENKKMIPTIYDTWLKSLSGDQYGF